MYGEMVIGDAMSVNGKYVVGRLFGKVTARCRMLDGSFQYLVKPVFGKSFWCTNVRVA